MTKPTDPKSKFELVRNWIVGITGVLLVIPALINGGIDIYSSWQKLPKTKAEQLNEELFKKYFKKQPVAAFPVPIKQSNGTVEVKFSVYEEGDVFVEFGNFTQWFPFPATEKKVTSISLMSTAIAQEQASLKGFGRYQQSEWFEGAYIVRERLYENGIIERLNIDPRTGAILQSSARRAHTPQNALPPPGVSNFAPIDLDSIRANRSQQLTGPATVCSTQFGACQMVAAISRGSQCLCYGAMGPVPGIAQ